MVVAPLAAKEKIAIDVGVGAVRGGVTRLIL